MGVIGHGAALSANTIREWICPRTRELYQLLDKAARLGRSCGS